ncbi:tetratricopeptide repeat protein [Polymorphospora rubra]|uniref:tetratricopeptide repeat protein n=1 Tax=Polymorphospora rubra TaxID=338584 RepID=UPI0033F9A840
MSRHTAGAEVALARVMAHCGGDPAEAMGYLSSAIAAAPHHPDAYAVIAELRQSASAATTAFVEGARSPGGLAAQAFLMFLDDDMDDAALTIGTITGFAPTVAWATAPWFGDPRFLTSVSAEALAEAAMRTMDYGHPLDTDDVRERFRPWFHAIETVSTRHPRPESLARMAILLRACGLIPASLALCDKADAVERTMLTEVVRGGTWRRIGDLEQAAAAFERATELDPTNWSLYLDLADIRADQGDFAAAVELTDRGLAHGPTEITLRAARAAYRTRLAGSAADLADLVEMAPQLPNAGYRNLLIDQACDGPNLPADLVVAARNVRES